MLRLTSRVAIAFLLVGLSIIIATRSAYCSEVATGGLDAPETGYTLGRISW